MMVAYPLSSGITLPTALAAPVEAGMMFWAAPRPSRQFFPDGPSTVFWVAVTAWMVVMRPSRIPNLSLMTYKMAISNDHPQMTVTRNGGGGGGSVSLTLARGARQFVVQEALDTTVMSLEYLSSLTPQTNMGASADGAEMMTFLAPPLKWAYDKGRQLIQQARQSLSMVWPGHIVVWIGNKRNKGITAMSL